MKHDRCRDYDLAAGAFVSRVLIILAVCLSPWQFAAAKSPPQRPPNVVLVMTDDQGYGDLRCHGNSLIKTPNLDRFHSDSVRFTDFHVDPTCSPTRAALLTGRYSTRAGVWHTIMGRSILFEDEVTLGTLFKNAGYRTGIFGKWHLGDNYPSRPQDRGFEEVLIHGGGGVGQTPDYWGNDYFDDTYLHNGQWKNFEGYCTKVFFENAQEFIRANREKPFFCYLPTNVPHGPNNVAAKYSLPYLNQGAPDYMAKFYGMITEFDENFGRLIDTLDELKLTENTIVIFMSDNGTAGGVWLGNRNGKKTPAPGWQGFNAGMRGQKGSQYDGGHRVPFFVRWPGGAVNGGRDVGQLAGHIDVLPTLAQLCGLQPALGRKLDGRSLVPLLQGRTSGWTHRALFAHFQREEIPPKWVRSAVMTERWRLIDGKELYDIKSDPGQQTDIAKSKPEVVEQLKLNYEQWWTSLVPSLARNGWIIVGTKNENPSAINCMDWHAPEIKEVPWNQPQIEKAPLANGYWMIDFAEAGNYEFTLRQRPTVANFAIEANTARVAVGNREITGTIPPNATSVTLALEVEAGRKRFQTWLSNTKTGSSRGAFFVEIKRLD